MERQLWGLTGVIVFIDDIIVAGSSKEQHVKRVPDILA